jgi:hypothetical protein
MKTLGDDDDADADSMIIVLPSISLVRDTKIQDEHQEIIEEQLNNELNVDKVTENHWI